MFARGCFNMNHPEQISTEQIVKALREYKYWCGSTSDAARDIHPLICDTAAERLVSQAAEIARLNDENLALTECKDKLVEQNKRLIRELGEAQHWERAAVDTLYSAATIGFCEHCSRANCCVAYAVSAEDGRDISCCKEFILCDPDKKSHREQEIHTAHNCKFSKCCDVVCAGTHAHDACFTCSLWERREPQEKGKESK